MRLELIAPDGWHEITLKQYKQLLLLPIPEEPSAEYRLKQVAILNPQYDIDTIGKATMAQIKDYVEQITFLDRQPELDHCRQIEIGGKKYEFGDFKYMSIEQWIDTENFYKLEDAHKLISIFYIPSETYDDKELEKVSQWFDNQPVTKYFWSVSFFLFMQKALEIAIQQFSEQGQVKQKRVGRIIEKSKLVKKTLGKMKLFGGKS